MDSGTQYRQLIQSLQQHQAGMHTQILEQQEEIGRLNKLIAELENQVNSYEESREG